MKILFFKKLAQLGSILCFLTAMHAMESQEVGVGIRKRFDPPVVQLEQAPDASAIELPTEMWDTILRKLPGNNRFLNEMARKMMLSPAVYQDIMTAFLARYGEKMNDFPLVNEMPLLLTTHFKTSRSPAIADQFAQALSIVRKRDALALYEPTKNDIAYLWDCLCYEWGSILIPLVHPTVVERERILKRMLMQNRYVIKLIDQCLRSSFFNQVYDYGQKLGELKPFHIMRENSDFKRFLAWLCVGITARILLYLYPSRAMNAGILIGIFCLGTWFMIMNLQELAIKYFGTIQLLNPLDRTVLLRQTPSQRAHTSHSYAHLLKHVAGLDHHMLMRWKSSINHYARMLYHLLQHPEDFDESLPLINNMIAFFRNHQ